MTELTYHNESDYLIPDLIAPASREIGFWGERHRRYLREHKSGIYTALLLSGRLDSILSNLNNQAEEMFSQLVTELAERDGITEKLKADDPILWIRRMNSALETAMEIVNYELIFM